MISKKILTLLLLICGSSFLLAQVRFSTNFDSGSIGNYKMVDSVWVKKAGGDSILTLSFEIESRFDPLNPVDSTLRPSARWYYFRMEGVKGKQIYLTIKNSEVIRPFYSYDNVNFKRFEENENLFKGSVNKIFTADTVYICHFVPYPYSRVKEKIGAWSSLPFSSHEIIGESYEGLPIEMITITDKTVDNTLKKRVWIHGRSHPSESPASWHLEGMIDEICNDSDLSKELRKNTIFYIIPFINPDGVKGGFSRSTSTGVNIEINWDRPDSLTMPEVKALKKTLERVSSDRPLDLLLNMHSQIANSVTYWIHDAESTTGKFLKDQLLLSSLTINYTPYYRSVDQSFSAVAPRYCEGWIWNRFKERTIAITFETPYTFYNENRQGIWVSTNNLKELGKSTLLAVSDLLNIGGEQRVVVEPKPVKRERRWLVSGDVNNVFFGDSFLISQKERARLSIKIKALNRGNYSLYKWVTGPAAKSFPENTNRWELISDIKVRKNGYYNLRYKSASKEDKVDAFLFVKE
ncbi:hypothetical protein MASR2M69_23410 [Bacteroidota bacterium]